MATPEWLSNGLSFESDSHKKRMPTAFSMVRLLLTLFSKGALRGSDLREGTKCLLKAVEEEMSSRVFATTILQARSLTDQVRFPLQSYLAIDDAALDYDRKRRCCHCQKVCFFSALCCACNDERMCCLDDSDFLCPCKR